MKIDPEIFNLPQRFGPQQVRTSTIEHYITPIRLQWPVATQLVDELNEPFQRSFNFIEVRSGSHIDEYSFPYGEHYTRLWVEFMEDSFASSAPWQRWEHFCTRYWARLYFKDESIANLNWSYSPPTQAVNPQGGHTHTFQGLWRVFNVDAGFALRCHVTCNAPHQIFLHHEPFTGELEVPEYDPQEDPLNPLEPVPPEWDVDYGAGLIAGSFFNAPLTDPPEIPGTLVSSPVLMTKRFLIILIRVPSSIGPQSQFQVNLNVDCRGKYEFTEPIPIESIREPPLVHPRPGIPIPPGKQPPTNFPSPPDPSSLPTFPWQERSTINPSLTPVPLALT